MSCTSFFYVFDKVPGSCAYRLSASIGRNESTESKTSGKESSPGEKTNASTNRDSPSLWVWLGPVIGVAATISVAFIIIFRCTRRHSAASNFQVASSSPVI